MSAHIAPDVSVILCAYTEARWDDLLAAVDSVQNQTLPPHEIILVIDHNPALLQRARANIDGVFIVENQEQRGESGGRNTGVATAQGQIVAFLDEDAVAEPDWLEKLTAAYVDPRVAGVGGHLEPLWLAGKPAWFPEEFNWVVGCSYRGMPEMAAPVRNLIGANMSFRRSLFQELGGFRSEMGRVGTIPLADAETEFCIRLKQRWPEAMLLHEPEARAHHRVPAHRGQWSYFRSRCYAEGLGKARMSGFVGGRDGLSTERAYTFKTLPVGVVRGLVDTVLRFDAGGLRRAGAIVAGLVLTTAGYLRYTLRKQPSGGGATAHDLDQPAPGLAAGRSALATHKDRRGDVL